MRGALTRRGLGRALLGAAAGTAGAAPLPRPVGKPILTITGRITRTNGADAARFDRPMLEALGAVGLVATTPRDDGPVRVDGVRMDRLMREVGATGDAVVAYTLGDDSVAIPVLDFARYDVLLALKRDGRCMAVRDGGPLFILYPDDSHPEPRRVGVYDHYIWQVVRLDVR
jgi:hypothetical protein